MADIIVIMSDLDLPIRSDIIALRGDTLESEVFSHLDPDGITPIDLTGCTLTCKGKLATGTAIDLSAYLVTDLPGGTYHLSVPPSLTNHATTPWPVGLGSYDITMVDSLGGIHTYFSGYLGLKEGAHV